MECILDGKFLLSQANKCENVCSRASPCNCKMSQFDGHKRNRIATRYKMGCTFTLCGDAMHAKSIQMVKESVTWVIYQYVWDTCCI